jgi:glycosyltransferase involved in cell wall biosynthesis
MIRALVLSQHFPYDDTWFALGIIQRLGLFVESMARVVDAVELLFLVPERNRAHVDAQPLKAHEARLRSRWSHKVQLRVHLVTMPNQAHWWRYASGLLSLRRQDIAFPLALDASARNALRAAFESRPDIVFVHRLGPMSIVAGLPARVRAMPVLFDLDDVEHIALFRRLIYSPDWPNERLKLLHLPAMLLGERHAIACSTTTFVCSDRDRRHIERWFGARNVSVVRNAVVPLPSPETPIDSKGLRPTMIFVGAFGYSPNVIAARELIEHIFPDVRRQVPDAELLIVGSGPDRIGLRDIGPGVRLAGYVPDIAAAYREARVVCCPIRSGSGTRIKIIEAAVFGKAVVSTRLGAEGIDLKENSEIVLADSCADMVSACVELLLNADRAAAFGRAARKRATPLYDREAVVSDVSRLIQKTLSAPREGLKK